MLFFMAGYTRRATGRAHGDLLKRSVGNAGLSHKQARGSIDKGFWSRMLDGEQALDVNALVEEVPAEPLLDFLARVFLGVSEKVPTETALDIVTHLSARIVAKAELRSPERSGKVA